MADMETKDIITAIGIGLTFAATVWNLLYTFSSNKKTRFINTVTSARIARATSNSVVAA